MANRKLTKSYLAISAFSATSEASGFAKENAVIRKSPQRAWRTTTTGSDQRLVIDLGATQTDITCYLDWVNFTSFKYQESADGSTGWSDIGTTRTVEKDPMHGVYRRVDNITLSSKQYLGILIPTGQSPVDGASYFRIGTFCVPTSIVELDADTTVEYPFEVTLPNSYIVENRFPGGQSEKVKLSILQPMLINVALKTTVLQNIKGDAVAEIGGLLRDSTQTIFLDFNLGESYQAYLVKKSGELRASVDSPHTGTADFGTLIFEVIV